MLSPDYLASCADDILGIYDNLQTAIAQDVAKSLVKHGGELISSASWQTERLQASGEVMHDVISDISSISKFSEDEVRAAFEKAAVKGIANDAEPLVTAGLLDAGSISLTADMMQSLEATILKTQGDLRNLTLTTGTTTYGLYLEQTNLAYMKVQSGAYSYQKAIADAIKASAEEGSWVLYGQRANGSQIRSRLDVAVRRSVMTGINQTCGKITEMLAADEEMGIEYYEVSAHLGARPTHMDWQGQVYKINGSDSHYRNFYDETGYGTGDGLCGYNCRHSFYPFWPGISKRAYTQEKLKEYEDKSYEVNGVTMSEYECSQTQRAYERSIRETKRTLASYDAAIQATDDESLKAELKDRFQSESVNLKATEKAMKEFCSATNRRTDSTRTQVVAYKDSSGRIVNFGRSTAQKAVWANKKS